MTKEFIPYEQALELKELGFDEECLTYYFKEHKELFFGSKPAYGEVIDAPLYQQAFRWFREKHNLHHFIELDGRVFNAVCQLSLVRVCKTYEEAELACLRKLIKIVKNKEQ